MLFLLFQLDQDRYALEARQVVEVLPLVNLKQIPHAPRCVAGLFNYRGRPVPAIDLSELTLGRPARSRLSTRIVVINYLGDNGEPHPLGLIAEKTTGTLRREPEDFVASGVSSDAAAYLGPVATDEQGLIQWIEVKQLLPASLRELLFRTPVAG